MNKRLLLAGLLLLCTCGQLVAEEAQKPTPGSPAGQDQQYGSVEERRLRESLKVGESPLLREREELENRKLELKRLEAEVDKKIEQLNQLRTQIEKQQAQKNATEQKRVAELAKVYEKMTADKAATLMGAVDQDLAIAILAKMKTKAAAKILNNMEREKAAKLTTGFSTLNSQ